MSTRPRVCVPQIIDENDLTVASQIATRENPRNAPGPFEIAGETKKFWRPGRILRCRFLGGDPVVQAKVEAIAHKWSEVANITFDFGDDPDAEIRISFAPTGSWSTVGTDAFLIPNGRATMNYGWLTPTSSDEEYNRVVLHEFGHALGMVHEHQHPEAGFTWDRDAVIAYYSGPPNNWSIQKIKFNVLDRYERSETQFSEFDVNSIMLYPIPNEHTVGDFSVDWRNSKLSETDKAFVASVYPQDVLPFDAAVVAPNNKLYVFRGANYTRISPGSGKDAGYPKLIADHWRNWPDSFADGIDAVMHYTDGKLYFFKGASYLRYTLGVGVDDGFPKLIADGWPALRF